MGTNFYAKIKMRPRSKERVESYLGDMREAISNGDVSKFSGALDDLVYDWGEIKNETFVHLGKRSAGWAFLWDLNNMKYYKPSLSSIISFIKENDAVIENEYGEEFTLDEFLNGEIGKCLHPDDAPMTEEDVKESNMSEERKEYVLNEYIYKGKPYFRYCTSETYAKMTGRTDSFFTDPYGMREKCREWTDPNRPIVGNATDFVTKDNIRCAIYTDFS